MEWLTNEVLLYGGIGIVVCTVVMAIIYSSVLRIQWIRMNVQMDEEYGKTESNRSGR